MTGADNISQIHEQLLSTFRTILEVDLPSEFLTTQKCERWDSLNHIKLILAIEQEFGIQLDIEDVELMYSSFERCLEHIITLTQR